VVRRGGRPRPAVHADGSDRENERTRISGALIFTLRSTACVASRRPSNAQLSRWPIASGAYGRQESIAESAAFVERIIVFARLSEGSRFAAAVRMLIDDSGVNAVTRQILGCAIEVHRELGPGLLESTYLPCLQYELSVHGLRFVAQKPVPIHYKEISLEASYRIDLVVEDIVLVEIKSVDALLPVHQAQALTYLRLTDCKAALLINFNVPRLMDGVRRLLNNKTERPGLTTGRHAEGTGSTGRPAGPAD
jgi:GxxExxY protein